MRLSLGRAPRRPAQLLRMKRHVTFALALAGITPSTLTPTETILEAKVAVHNRLKSSVANISIEHVYGSRQTEIIHWQIVEPRQLSDARMITYATGGFTNDYWMVSWSTQDGNITCSLTRSNSLKPSSYEVHDLRKADSNTTITIGVVAGVSTPGVLIESISGVSKEYLDCIWSNGDGAVDMSSLIQYGLIKHSDRSTRARIAPHSRDLN